MYVGRYARGSLTQAESRNMAQGSLDTTQAQKGVAAHWGDAHRAFTTASQAGVPTGALEGSRQAAPDHAAPRQAAAAGGASHARRAAIMVA
jgi:hypothetical protein